MQMIEQELEQVERTKMKCYRYGFFSRSGFAEDVNRKDFILIKLSNLFADVN